jgi:aminoglycoside 6'-N-acetyltransferase
MSEAGREPERAPGAIEGELTRLRPAGERDAAMLVAWHADPEVSRYWDDETYTHEQMLAELREELVERWIVQEGGEPVGYIQAWWEAETPLEGGLDMFLVPAARGRGLGPDAARALATHLLDERGWRQVTVDPYLWNERAIRGWRKAGFEPVEEREPDESRPARWLLMRFAS